MAKKQDFDKDIHLSFLCAANVAAITKETVRRRKTVNINIIGDVSIVLKMAVEVVLLLVLKKQNYIQQFAEHLIRCLRIKKKP